MQNHAYNRQMPETIMTILRTLPVLATAGLLLLSACQGDDPTGPDLLDFSMEDQLALELLSDPSTTETALELAGVQAAAAHGRGWSWGSKSNPSAQAENCFQEARNALQQGDLLRARDRLREGRRLVAESIRMSGGHKSLLGMVERLETLPSAVEADPDAFVNPGQLGLQLGQLASMARKAYGAGNQIRAGALGVLAEQAFRNRYRHRIQTALADPALAVDLGAEALELATRLLSDPSGVTSTESQGYLATAEEYLASAQEALEAGEDVRAAHLAQLAAWWALKAVILPGGITDEEAQDLLSLAETLLAEAVTAVGPEPDAVQAALLKRATDLLERGEANLSSGACRGIGASWQSAVISSYLAG